jgi:hypothetical protein
MPPILWNFDGKVLVVKIIGSHTTEDISRAFTEAMIECPTGATLLVDIRSAFISISPDGLRERVQLIFDSIRGKISRYAIVSKPQGMVSLAESAAVRLTALGMDTRYFTRMEDAFAWLESPASG